MPPPTGPRFDVLGGFVEVSNGQATVHYYEHSDVGSPMPIPELLSQLQANPKNLELAISPDQVEGLKAFLASFLQPA